LKEDGNHLPTPTETERFFGDVDELSNDFARIEARLSRIREKLEKNDQDKD
jgi:ubiquinone biosynthesis protein UbiJ